MISLTIVLTPDIIFPQFYPHRSCQGGDHTDRHSKYRRLVKHEYVLHIGYKKKGGYKKQINNKNGQHQFVLERERIEYRKFVRPVFKG